MLWILAGVTQYIVKTKQQGTNPSIYILKHSRKWVSEDQANSKRTPQLHAERPPGKDGTQKRDLLAGREQHPLSHCAAPKDNYSYL